jgi:predicted glycogen debranching enzyme
MAARSDSSNWAVDLSREITGDLAAACAREWLVTNGIGGYAAGTVAGVLTRRYHGLLVAALSPPVGRTLLVAKIEETARVVGQDFPLSTNRWRGGAVAPQGWAYTERFHLEGAVPVWTFAFADGIELEKRVWMRQGANTTCVLYNLRRASQPVEISIKALVNYRDYHGVTHAGDWQMRVDPVAHGLRITALDGARPYYLLSGAAIPDAPGARDWYRDFDLALERERGMDDSEDHLMAGTFRATIEAGGSLAFFATTEPDTSLDAARALEEQRARERSLLSAWATSRGASAALPKQGASSKRNARSQPPAWIQQLVLAANAFLVARPSTGESGPCTVIAGYPWFSDWGRDTMIALPGLTLATGRPEIAWSILRAYARYVDGGMLPNAFPDTGLPPEYNSVDAALWYFEAARQTFAATRDLAALRQLFPILKEIVDAHVRGTRFGIHVDPADGLLAAGEPGVQLTWMDAKIGDWVVTPRIGKPVEVNALWLNALETMAGFARALKQSATPYEQMAQKARAGSARFWNPARGYCFDVLDGPSGNEQALRPNQILAVSLPVSPLPPKQQRAVVDVCERELLAGFALRTLGPAEPGYRGRYIGPQNDRDAAYHEGTAWPWLLGPFVLAHLRVHRDPAAAAAYLIPIAQHITTYGLGSVAEICDGDPPFTPRGCFAQAWSVAEILRAWTAVEAAR